MTTPGGWDAPTNPGTFVIPAAVGGAGIANHSQMTEADWKAVLEANARPHWEGLGDPIEVLRELVQAIISAFQGDLDPLIDLVGDAVREIPVVGDFIAGLIDALRGDYDGDDQNLLNIQTWSTGLVDFVNDLASAAKGEYTGGDVVLTGVSNIIAGLRNTVVTIQNFVNDLINAILRAIRGIPVVGGTLADIISDLGGLKTTAVQAHAGVGDTIEAMHSTWFGEASMKTVSEVVATVESIHDSIFLAWNVETFNATTAGWTIPGAAKDVVVSAVSGGVNGVANAGAGGIGGSHNAVAIDVTSVTALDIAVPGPGGPAIVRKAAATPHTGQELLRVTTGEPSGSVPTEFGFAPSGSAAGNGGRGTASPESGVAGQPSAAAVGGLGGTLSFANSALPNGADGGSISAGTTIKCGGGGGGGGCGWAGNGAELPIGYKGGRGGNGGFPGGGGGGGGATTIYGGGEAGNGAAGCVWVFWR